MASLDNMSVWNPLENNRFGLMNTVSDSIAKLERKRSEGLTTLRLGPKLLMVSDYSGHHHGATHEVLSFLLADAIFLWRWNEDRQMMRRRCRLGKRRMAFKAMGDRIRRRALNQFLAASNSIPGLSYTVLIDKRINSLFLPDTGTEERDSLTPLLVNWKPKVRERFLRVAHFGFLLVTGLSAKGQDFLWITDEDDIVANTSRLKEATKALAHISSHYLRHGLGHLRFGTTKCDDGSLALEDLAAIPDLVAGALGEMAAAQEIPGGDIFVPIEAGISIKSREILGWLAESTHTLKRIVMGIDLLQNDRLIVRVFHFGFGTSLS